MEIRLHRGEIDAGAQVRQIVENLEGDLIDVGVEIGKDLSAGAHGRLHLFVDFLPEELSWKADAQTGDFFVEVVDPLKGRLAPGLRIG